MAKDLRVGHACRWILTNAPSGSPPPPPVPGPGRCTPELPSPPGLKLNSVVSRLLGCTRRLAPCVRACVHACVCVCMRAFAFAACARVFVCACVWVRVCVFVSRSVQVVCVRVTACVMCVCSRGGLDEKYGRSFLRLPVPVRCSFPVAHFAPSLSLSLSPTLYPSLFFRVNAQVIIRVLQSIHVTVVTGEGSSHAASDPNPHPSRCQRIVPCQIMGPLRPDCPSRTLCHSGCL